VLRKNLALVNTGLLKRLRTSLRLFQSFSIGQSWMKQTKNNSNWLTRRLKPENLASLRIENSIGDWGGSLPKQMASHSVELERIKSLHRACLAGQRKFMLGVDDREKEYKIYADEVK
jgi:hypothetical protein